MEFLTDFGKKQYEAQERQRKAMLEQAYMGIANAKKWQEDINNRSMDRMRIQAMGKLTPFGNDGFSGGNPGIDYEQNRQIIQAYESTQGVPEQRLPASFSQGGRLLGRTMGGRIDTDSLVVVQDQPSFSLMENVLRRNLENYEQNELIAEYNDDAVTETELEGIEQSKVKVLDILRGITSKLSAGIRKRSEAFGLSFLEDLKQVYQELLNWGYGYDRKDLERIRVYLEEEPALVKVDIGEKAGEPVNKLAVDILNRIVKPMLSPSFIGSIKEKKLLMEPIIEGFYKTINPRETGTTVPEELRVSSFAEITTRYNELEAIYDQMDDLRRRQGNQQSQRVQNEMLALKKQFDERAGLLYGSIMAYSMGDIYTFDAQEIQRARNDFNMLSPERKLDVLNEAITQYEMGAERDPSSVAEQSYAPEMYQESEFPPFSQFGEELPRSEVEQPLEMPEAPGEGESKEEMPESASAIPRRPGRRPGRPQESPRAFEFENMPKDIPRNRDGSPDKRSRQYREWIRTRGEMEPASSKLPAEMPSFPFATEEEEIEGSEGGPSELPEGSGRKKKPTGKTERMRVYRSGKLKPETFKSFISSLVKQFDDSRVLRRL